MLSNFSLRNCKQHGEAALFGFCFLRVKTGAPPVLTCTTRCGFSAVTHHDGYGGAAAKRPFGIPVEMSTGTKRDRFTLHYKLHEISEGNTEVREILSPHVLMKDYSGVESACDMTEKRIFTMAGQVASALVGLTFCHSKILTVSLTVSRINLLYLWE